MPVDYQLRLKVQFRFQNLVQRRFKKLGVGVSSECEQEMEKMISIGVTRLAVLARWQGWEALESEA